MPERVPRYRFTPYLVNGRKHLRDPIRNIFVLATPEEVVRQSIVRWLTGAKRWPAPAILTEYNCLRDGLGVGRADIALVRPATPEELSTSPIPRTFVGVIESKRRSDPLADHVEQQALSYAQKMGAEIVGITNGEYFHTWMWEPRRRGYAPKQRFPKYREVLRGQSPPDQPEPSFVRPSWAQLNDPVYLHRNLTAYKQEFVCDSSRLWIKKHAFDLYALFRSPALAPQLPWIGHGVRVRQDWGPSFKEFGNSSGGSYAGYYRTFLVDEGSGSTPKSIHFGIFSVAGQGRNSGKVVRTSLIVAVSDKVRRHNSLQLWVERFWRLSGEAIEVTHDGRIAIGRQGSGRRSTVMALVRREAPSLVRGTEVFLAGCGKTA